MAVSTAGGNDQASAPSASPAAHGQAPTSARTNNVRNVGSGTTGDAEQNGQAPTAIPPQPSQPSADDTSAPYAPPSADEWKRVQQELAESRRESARARQELKKHEDAQLTAEQKRERDFSDLQTKNAEYELRLQRLSLENAGHRLGASLGIGDLAAALAILQVEHANDLAFAEDGSPQNLEALLKDVLAKHPLLAAQQQPPATPIAPTYGALGATNPPRAGQIAGANGSFSQNEIPRLTDPRLWRRGS